MTSELKRDLELCETDLESAMDRFSGDEPLYISLLQAFLNDPTMDIISKAIDEQAWDDAFTAAHALKGLAGNLGFVPLFHATGELVLHIRKANLSEVKEAKKRVMRCYRMISDAIQNNLADGLPHKAE